MSSVVHKTRPTSCAKCGKPIEQKATGRPRQFCEGASCRQGEARQRVKRLIGSVQLRALQQLGDQDLVAIPRDLFDELLRQADALHEATTQDPDFLTFDATRRPVGAKQLKAVNRVRLTRPILKTLSEVEKTAKVIKSSRTEPVAESQRGMGT